VNWLSGETTTPLPKKKKKKRDTSGFVGEENWVPPAYRGVKADVEVRLRREKRKQWQEKKETKFEPFETKRLRENSIHAKSKIENILAGLYIEIMKITPTYRNLFHTSPVFQPPSDEELNKRAIKVDGLFYAKGKRMRKRIAAALDKIHDGDIVVDLPLLKNSENTFWKITDNMMKMCANFASLSRSHDIGMNRSVEHAEFCLIKLVEFGSTRETLYQKILDQNIPTNEGESDDKDFVSSSPEDNSMSNVQSHVDMPNEGKMQSELESIAEKIKKTLVNREDPIPEEQRTLLEQSEKQSSLERRDWKGKDVVNGHSKEADTTKSGMNFTADDSFGEIDAEDSVKKENSEEESALNGSPQYLQQYLVETNQLFFQVISSLASAAQANTQNFENWKPVDSTARKNYEKLAWRMIDLLSLMPAQWRERPGANSLQCIMETLKKAGTLDCAKQCHELFQRNPQEIDFTHVLESYLEAVRHEEDQQERVNIVRQVLEALYVFWDLNIKRFQKDRIRHASIVLQCISVGNVSDEKAMCYKADVLAKRAVGKLLYAELDQDLHSENPKFVHADVLPLMNYLVQVYAQSTNDFKVEMAKRMLDYMLRQQDQLDAVKLAPLRTYSTVDTFNAVLFALVKRYDGKSVDEIDTARMEADFIFAKNHFDFICELKRKGCAPNALTQKLIFRLLDVVAPNDSEKMVEDILSKLETKHYLAETDDSAISLTTYHRVLTYWRESAKSQRNVSLHQTSFHKAFILLERLEIQSTPLLFNIQAIASMSTPSLYNVSLKPVKFTYKLVLQTCAETQDPIHQEAAVHAAFDVNHKMKIRGIHADEETVNLLVQCLSRLPEGCETRLKLERLIPEISDSVEEEEEENELK
jgi:hypothetical protein